MYCLSNYCLFTVLFGNIIFTYTDNHLYWVLQEDGKIQSLDLKTNTTKTVFNGSTSVGYTLGMSMCDGELYITDGCNL